MNEKFEVLIDELPKCQGVHADEIPDATYDAQIRGKTTWAYFCHRCFLLYAGRLGVGLGQRLVIKPTEADIQAWENEHRAEAEENWDQLNDIITLELQLKKCTAMQKAYKKVIPAGNIVLQQKIDALTAAIQALKG